MFTPVKRGASRLLSSGTFSALKSEKLQGGIPSDDFSRSLPSGPVQGWWNDEATLLGGGALGGPLAHNTPTRPGLQSPLQPFTAAHLPMPFKEPLAEQNLGTHVQDLSQVYLVPRLEEICDEQPALDMEAFLQELSLSETSSSQADLSGYDPADLLQAPASTVASSPTAALSPTFATTYDPLLAIAAVDINQAVQHFTAMPFEALSATIIGHLWNTGPVPDVALFYLFRKVHNKEQADQAVTALVTDREVRTSQGIATPYSEVTSAAVFNALNRTGGETLVVAAAEKAYELGLTLSRSNMYHLMKQYSVQGKADHVEKLFRALESTGKSWNSNCIVIMMLAYFNQGRFEDADKLRRELTARGIKISERIETRLEKLLAGEEKWKWEDKVYERPRKVLPVAPPPGFQPLGRPYLHSHNVLRPYGQLLSARSFHSEAMMPAHGDPEREATLPELRPVTLKIAVKEPRIHLNILRAAGFDDLFKVLEEFVRTEGPVENVCISFLFRKVETKHDVERAMAFLKEERAARAAAGISEEYNETTCSRIFTALFRTGASDAAFAYADKAQMHGLVLSGKALHELLKNFAARNDVERVEDIWKLVKLNGKPSSRIVYSIFRTYFDNGMMERASAFHKEIQSIGIKLSASATRNIEDVLSGVKSWVRDPHANEF